MRSIIYLYETHKTTPNGFSYLCIFQPAPCIWLRLCLREHRSTYLPNTERAQLSLSYREARVARNQSKTIRGISHNKHVVLVLIVNRLYNQAGRQAIVNAIGLVIRAWDTCSFWLTPQCLAHIVKTVMSSQVSHHENIVISRSVELSQSLNEFAACRSIDRSITVTVPGVRTLIVVPRQPNRPIYSLYK